MKKGARVVNAKERIAYLRGLLDCMEPEERNTKVLAAVVEALDALALEIEEHAGILDHVRETSEGLTDEIYELHDAVYELEQSIGLDTDQDYDEADTDEPAESYISVTCPSCAYSFYYRYEEDKEEEKLVCPGCGEEIDRSV